jgi:hypothetical protein
VQLKFEELCTSLQTVHGAAWKEPNANTFKVSSWRIIPPPPPLTVSQPPTLSSVIAWHSYCLGVFSFLSVFTHGKAFYIWWHIQKKSYSVRSCAERIGNRTAGRKYTVSEACVRHWWSIKTTLFSCLTNIKYFFGPKKGRNPEIDASVLEYIKDLQNKGLHKDSAKRKFLQRCNSLGPNECMDDIGVIGRLAWMCMGTST